MIFHIFVPPQFLSIHRVNCDGHERELHLIYLFQRAPPSTTGSLSNSCWFCNTPITLCGEYNHLFEFFAMKYEAIHAIQYPSISHIPPKHRAGGIFSTCTIDYPHLGSKFAKVTRSKGTLRVFSADPYHCHAGGDTLRSTVSG